METWWDRYPEAYERELEALDASGYEWAKDEEAFEGGRLILCVRVQLEGESLRLTARYPDTFPYFPPDVTYEGKQLSRHHHPVQKNLCLLANEGDDWIPEKDTLAGLLDIQLPKILSVNQPGASEEFVSDNEDHLGEPLTAFLHYYPYSAIVVPDETPPHEAESGKIEIKLYAPISRNHGNNQPIPVRGIISSISDQTGYELFKTEVMPANLNTSISGYWIRLPERPPLESAYDLRRNLFKLFAESNKKAFEKMNRGKRGQVFIIGFIWPDEQSWRNTSDDWLFLRIEVTNQQKRSQNANFNLEMIRADWGGENAWMQRAPTLRSLRNKKALIIGLGAIGSPLVVNLVKAGIGSVFLIDHDHLQVGNTIRWALGWQGIGLSKVAALRMYISTNYPYTEVDGSDLHIGLGVRVGTEQQSEYDFIKGKMLEADIIIDASANHRVSHFLADMAQWISKPYLWLTSTHGSAGGVVGRIQPGKSEGCWHCFQYSLYDQSIRMPADSGDGTIQAGGCSQATFIGAGIDSDEISLLTSRLAIATLCAGESESYPDFNWDVAVADLRRDGLSIAPDWTTYTLHKHDKCEAHSE